MAFHLPLTTSAALQAERSENLSPTFQTLVPHPPTLNLTQQRRFTLHPSSPPIRARCPPENQSEVGAAISRPKREGCARHRPIKIWTYVGQIVHSAIVNITCRLSNYTGDFLPPLDYKFFSARFGERRGEREERALQPGDNCD